jgi:hypothetical protein
MAENNSQDDSPYRVALDLLKEIERKTLDADIQPNPRLFYLKLYDQCRKVVLGYNAADVIEELSR